MSIVTSIVTTSGATNVPSGATYTPAMMQFDGSTGYYTKTGITTSGNKVTVVGRFSVDSFTGGASKIVCQSYNPSVRLQAFVIASDHATTTRRNKFMFVVWNSSATPIAAFLSNSDVTDGNNHSFLVSYDGDNGTGSLIIDGVDELDTGNPEHILTTGTPSGGSEFWVGTDTITTKKWSGTLGFFGYADSYLTNYSDFFDSNNYPIKQDETTWPNSGWGSQPLFWNEHGDMANNKGSAGNMTENGTIVVADAVDPAA